MRDLPPLPLPHGVRSAHVLTESGLDQHYLHAGEPDRPMLLLLHGFPELAFSWRRVMLPLAQAGHYVVAPDQRGYGRTTGWQGMTTTSPLFPCRAWCATRSPSRGRSGAQCTPSSATISARRWRPGPR